MNVHFHLPLFPFSNRGNGAAGGLAILMLALSSLSGCAASRLRMDYKGYENSYAESSNRQLLLNLARLNQHHPTYFFKLGPISTTYRIQGTLSATGSQVAGLYTNPLNKTITGGGTPGTLLEQDPTFTFIPVNDDTVAKQLLTPIPDEFFYTYFQEGWRIDMLFRSMVDRIEFHQKTESGGDSLQVIRNVATADNIAGYLTFLRISAELYEFQRRGHLVISGKSNFRSIMTIEATADFKIAPKDITDAQAKGLIWKKTADGKSWELGQNEFEPEFKLNLPDLKDSKTICPDPMPKVPDYFKAITPQEQLLVCQIFYDKDVSILTEAASLIPTLRLLESGISVSNSPEGGGARIVLRSLIGVMAAAGQEQNTYNDVINDKVAGAQDPLPAVESRPLLKLIWSEETELTSSLVDLDYLGKHYRVADEHSDTALNESTWNRDVFRLIAELASQITVDISKFPLPTVLQIRPQ